MLISEPDWRVLQETEYLLSVLGMRELIREDLETPLEDCSQDQPGLVNSETSCGTMESFLQSKPFFSSKTA